MDSRNFTPGNVKEWLEHAPQDPGPRAAGLRGFIIQEHFYCTYCCGRLSQRGIILPGDSIPAWTDLNPARQCAACGAPV